MYHVANSEGQGIQNEIRQISLFMIFELLKSMKLIYSIAESKHQNTDYSEQDPPIFFKVLHKLLKNKETHMKPYEN